MDEELEATEPPVADGPPPPGPAGSIDDVRARLEARGLLRESPVPLPKLEDLALTAPLSAEVGDLLDEAVEQEMPEPGYPPATATGSTTRAECPACARGSDVPVRETGFKCRGCDRSWRWGICANCRVMSLVVANHKSWRCPSCVHYTRSWWITPNAADYAQRVIDRRWEELGTQNAEREEVYSKRGRVLTVLTAAVVVTVLVAIGLLFANRPPSASEASRQVCVRFELFRSEIANGTVDADQYTTVLSQLRVKAVRAEADVRVAVQNLADAGLPGSAAFLVAQADLTNACET